MVKCLFAVEDTIPLTPNFSGASSLAYSQLQLLVHAGVEVHVVVFCRELPSARFQDYTLTQSVAWANVREWSTSHRLFHLEFAPRRSVPLRTFLKRLLTPLADITPLTATTEKDLELIVDQIKPDLIWGVDLWLASILQSRFPTAKIVYTHFDWKWKIKSKRSSVNGFSLRKAVEYQLMRQHEEAVARHVAACVSASASEVEEMGRLGVRLARYFPTLYAPAAPLSPPVTEEQPRLVHLGTMQATANRIGLKRFLQVTWPIIEAQCAPPPLWIIGDLGGADNELLQLLESANAVCTGFVPDLATVLRPYDLHIIPWEYNTGTRTRIPLALSYGQVVVSTQSAASCLPELAHQNNAVLVRDLQEMGTIICSILSEPDRLVQIGQAGYQLFEENYTREAVQPDFNTFIEEVCHGL